jgi:hypothetical protein
VKEMFQVPRLASAASSYSIPRWPDAPTPTNKVAATCIGFSPGRDLGMVSHALT